MRYKKNQGENEHLTHK